MSEISLKTGFIYDLATLDCKAPAPGPALLLALLLAACAAPAAPLEGWARVIDGDTLAIGAAVVRIHGIDAPELAQDCHAGGRPYACGQAAKAALAALLGGPVACSPGGARSYGRLVAVCQSGGRDLGAVMVAAGWALAYRKYSRAYVELEAEAAAARRGLWAGQFTAPWTWRRARKKPPRR